MKLSIKGIIPPVITPLINNEKIDVNGLEKLIEHLILGGVHGLFFLGTNGEATSLSYKLRKDLIKRACEFVNKRVPIFVGITDTTFAGSLEIAEYSRFVGADAVVVAPPYYVPISQEEMVDYLKNLIPALTLPFLLYNIPYCTKLHLSLETVKRAKELGAIGIKDSSGDMFYMYTLLNEFKDSSDFSIMTGTELFLSDTVIQGGHGAVPGGANLFPRLFVDLYEASVAKDIKKIAILREQVMKINNTIYNVGNFSSKITKGIKCALSVMNICNDYMAFPFRKFEGVEREQIKKFVEEFNNVE